MSEEHEISDGVKKAIEKIASQNDGRVTADEVLDAARDPGSPLHSHFEWDDGEAAEKYRRIQASGLIRRVKMTVVTTTQRIHFSKFVRNPGPTQGYVAITRARSEADLAREICISAFDRARNALTQAKNVANFLELTTEIEIFVKEIEALAKRCRESGDDSNVA